MTSVTAVPSVKADRGYTIPEATVAALLFVSVVLALSLSLITEAGRRVAYSGLRAGEPLTASVLDRIRADVQGSQSVVTPPDYDPYASWYVGPLTVSGHWSGRRISYASANGALYRIVQGSGEPQVAEVLPNVAVLRWTFVDEAPRATVMLEIVRVQSAAFRAAAGARAQFADEVAAERIVVMPRQGGRTTW